MTRQPDQCREDAPCGSPCILSRRVPHTIHVCSARGCACHNTYVRRVNDWQAHHYFAASYPVAIESYRQWQTNPAVLDGPAWVRRNGHDATE